LIFFLFCVSIFSQADGIEFEFELYTININNKKRTALILIGQRQDYL